MIGGRLARATFEPELAMTDGEAMLVANPMAVGVADAERVIEAWNPYRAMFNVVWSGRRHVMMGATQIDRYGNQNIAAIGDYSRPAVMLIGFRGAPGNTINHVTSYWIPNHSPRVFVEHVDVVCGIGYDRAAALGPDATRYHEVRHVVSNLGVFDFETPDHRMRLRSVHWGVAVADVVAATGFELVIPHDVPQTRMPSDEDLRLIRSVIDPTGTRKGELVR
jgi:acyl CoA:acetate/3-ketoacid CoA transferase beta subunit